MPHLLDYAFFFALFRHSNTVRRPVLLVLQVQINVCSNRVKSMLLTALPKLLYKATLKYFKSGPVIVIALIAFVILVIAYRQCHKPQGTDDQVQYTGRVMHAVTQHPIANAKISVETQGPPNVYYTDTEGIFNLKLPKTVDAARIRVEAEGYELFDRNISVSRTGLEYVLLSPIPISSPTPSPSPPEKTEKVRKASAPKSQRRRTKVPCSTQDALLGKCVQNNL